MTSHSGVPLILIVDDDKVSTLTLKRLLGKEGYRVEVAGGGRAGLELARRLQPDLVLLDILMPEMDGYEVCEALRQDPELGEVPVVMLTALDDQESRVKGIEAGADDFISKPYHPAVLRAKVKTVTSLNRFRRIRTERARFGWVVENAEEGYLLADEAGRLLYANGMSRSILGLRDENADCDVLGLIRSQFKLQPQESWDLWPDLPEDSTLHLLRPESPMAPAVWLAVRALGITLGAGREVLLQLRDVTAEMASARSVWSFESLISHKLRTPLTKITWGLTFLTKKAHKLSTDQVVDFAQMSQAGVEELQRELEEVLSYVNAPSGVPEGSGFRFSSLEHVMNEVCDHLALSPIQTELAEGLPESVYLSHRAFEMVMWELLQNSKKFHPQKLPHVEFRARPGERSTVVLEISDDGCSLSPEQLSRAFTPYYQGEKSFTGQVPGMGLGLSMVASLVWEVGGDCTLRNRESGEGVVVELVLPCGKG